MDLGIPADDAHVLNQSLRNQQPIEGVPVVVRKVGHLECVRQVDRQDFKRVALELVRQENGKVLRNSQFAIASPQAAVRRNPVPSTPAPGRYPAYAAPVDPGWVQDARWASPPGQ